MGYKSSKLWSLFVCLLILNSLIYYDSTPKDYNFQNLNGDNILDTIDKEENIKNDDTISNPRIKQDQIAGDYKTFAFFTGGGTEAGNDLIDDPEYPTDPENNNTDWYPNVIEWVTYDDIKDGDHIPKELYWRALNTEPITWPSTANVWHQMRERNDPHEPSKMFSPVFTEDWEISGRVYYLTYIEASSFSESVDIDMRFSLHLFNPVDYNKTMITSDIQSIPIDTFLNQRTFSSEIAGTYTVPAGYRLLYDIEYRFDSIPSSGSLLMYTGYPNGGGGSLTWTINDPTYGNVYTLHNNQRMAGIQLYMRSKEFPDINVFGVTNNTVYQTPQVVSIDVTEGSISSFRWDGGTWNNFNDETQESLPTTHGWHYLEIKASDPVFNNTNVVMYKYGYDASADNILLHNAISGDQLSGGFVLNFSVFNLDSVTYEWDANGTEFPLSSPFDIITDQFTGWHNLTIKTTDFYENNSYFYLFEFDSDNPIIYLANAMNGSVYLPGRSIILSITDNAAFDYLKYNWDSGANQSWTVDPSNLYTTSLPILFGIRTLEIFVSDEFNHTAYSYYEFLVDDTIFGVDLVNLVDGGYYQGGNTVELIVQQSNGTCYYKWNEGIEKNETIVGDSLVLDGIDAMPVIEGLNILTIRTFNWTNHEHFFNFSFIVDHTAPSISNIQSYNESRYQNTQAFLIYVVDNFVDNLSLIIEYSINGKIYKNLPHPFVFSLQVYLDDDYTLDLRVRDSAGNIGYVSIIFTIDSTKPDITVIIPDLQDLSFIDGNMYVPANAEVQVIITDDDPTTYSFYQIDSGPKIPFTDSFILINPDGSLGLNIYASDTLGNEGIDPYVLIIDSLAPNVILSSPSNYSKINEFTKLTFNTQDENEVTIDIVGYYWAILPGWFYPDIDFSTNISLYKLLYDTNDTATIFIEASDILGNVKLYNYSFLIDFTAPVGDIYYYNETSLMLELAEPGEYYEVPGNTRLWYDLDLDIDHISFRWLEDEEDTKIDAPFNAWFENVSLIDGSHNLTITFVDDTVGDNPNNITKIYYFIVNDINMTFIYPSYFTNDNHTTLTYNDTFIYQVEITNSTQQQINDLTYIIDRDLSINLSVSVSNISTVYEIIIHATNVSYISETNVFVIFKRSSGGGESVRLYLTILKKEGNLTILDQTDNSVEYKEDIQIFVKLNDNLGDNRSIIKLFVNSTDIEFQEITDFIFDNETYICSFNYSTFNFGRKGNFSISISAESLFYYANTTSSTIIDIEIRPIPVYLTMWVSNSTILEGSAVSIYANLTLIDGTPISYETVTFYIYLYYKNEIGEPTLLRLAITDFNDSVEIIDLTNTDGLASTIYTLESNIAYIRLACSYGGNNTLDQIFYEFQDLVITFPPPEPEVFPKWLMYTIIGGSIALVAIISFIIYKLTRPKPFESLMERVSEEELTTNYSIMSPGVILTIFDQRKGPVPLVDDHSLSIARYRNRIAIGIENFLLKISDQAYSSLGFEEHTTERRTGSIRLPREQMIGMIHGIQLENKTARGGFENLSLIVLADNEYGNLLLSYQEFIYEDIDELISKLKSKKSLAEVREAISEIRRKSVIVMLAAQQYELSQNGN